MLREKPRTMYCRAAVVAGVFILALIRPAHAVTLEWVQQLDTGSARGVSADGLGNVYIAGHSSSDAFLAKYDAAGRLQWNREVDASGGLAWAVSADGMGNVYISGETRALGGTLVDHDAFLARYDAAGNLQWMRQQGTSGFDQAWGVSPDGLGNVYICGSMGGDLAAPDFVAEGFVSKYDDAGQLQWTRQLGGPEHTRAWAVSADGIGNVYITGETYGSLGGPNAGLSDIYLAKYDAAGNALWTRQLGTAVYDSPWDVAVDRLGNVYISADTLGSLGEPNVGSKDGFLAKYDPAGELQWTRQIGTPYNDSATGVSPDDLGNVYVTGTTEGDLIGTTTGLRYVYVAKFDSVGARQWMTQTEVTPRSFTYGVSADGLGSAYIAGGIYSNELLAPFVARYRDLPVPEPSSALLLLSSCLLLARRRGHAT